MLYRLVNIIAALQCLFAKQTVRTTIRVSGWWRRMSQFWTTTPLCKAHTQAMAMLLCILYNLIFCKNVFRFFSVVDMVLVEVGIQFCWACKYYSFVLGSWNLICEQCHGCILRVLCVFRLYIWFYDTLIKLQTNTRGCESSLKTQKYICYLRVSMALYLLTSKQSPIPTYE